jgi:hypothetical protein
MIMSTPLSTLTTNVNFLQQVNFKLTIQNPNFTNIEYFCTGANLPAITMGEVTMNYRNLVSYFPGDHLVFDQLRVKFMVDENMTNYLEAVNWMRNNAYEASAYRSDLILSVLTSKNTINRQYQFVDAFPTSIGELAFNTQAQTVEYISCEMGLRFNYFKVLPV